MANVAKSAILRALIEGVITDLMVKTNSSNVYVDDNTTLSAKLSEIITTLNSKAAATDLEAGLSARPTTTEMNTAIAQEISKLIGGAPETYDTLKDIADYISSHEDVVDTLNAAIGSKADATTVSSIKSTVDALGALSKHNLVTEDLLGTELKAKVNAAAQGNHSHDNKALLDTYTQTNANLADAVSKKHSHSNASVLNGITEDKVEEWDGKGRFFAQAGQPADLGECDLWAQIIQ